jgi:FkbM family methyltransferase
MARVRPDDVIADVGAFIGLYAVAMAKRLVGPGRVFAFEPDPQNLSLLKAQVELNRVGERTIIINAAVSDHDGVVPFIVGRRDVSRVYTGVTDLKQLDEMYPGLPVSVRENEPQPVKCVRLDTIFGAARLDILKIDVEGHERRCSGVALV